MATLQARFDAVQEQLLQIYESEENSLDVQLEYWLLLRKEQALYYYARQQGINRLGLFPVPPARVSEKRAKDAIAMSLQLQSLKKSPYGSETWTMTQTSRETFLAEPSNTFKKRPAQATVVYDNDVLNSMLYTVYNDIYYADENDVWYKVHSTVNYDGIYYTDHLGTHHYYVKFADDAYSYSNSGQWQVLYENQVFSAPVTSSTSGSTGAPAAEPEAGKNATTTETDSTATRSQQPATATQRRSVRPVSRSGSRSSSRSRSPQRSPLERSSRSPTCPRESTPARGRRRPRRRRSLRRRRTSEGSATEGSSDGGEFGGRTPPSPEQVGSRSRTPERRPSSRLAQLISDAYDPPVLIFQGPANILKCWRRRCTQKYYSLFTHMSTTFTWLSGSGVKSTNRMLAAFASTAQRELFLDTVKTPKGVTWGFGSLDCL